MSSDLHVLVTGAAGMIGQKLLARLMREPRLGGEPIARMTLVDVAAPAAPKGAPFKVQTRAGDLSLPGEASAAVADSPHYVFHLAGVVSGEAETDFDKGYRVNIDGTRFLFEAIRQRGHKPRVVFTSSAAVYGGPFDGPVTDDFHLTPHSSYGVAKAIGEQLLADYSRRGFFNGVGIRLPAITVRPGKPNKAASGEQIEALRKVGGDAAVARIQRIRDMLVERIVASWPHVFEAKRALSLGFVPDRDFDEIVAIHIEEDLGGKARE